MHNCRQCVIEFKFLNSRSLHPCKKFEHGCSSVEKSNNRYVLQFFIRAQAFPKDSPFVKSKLFIIIYRFVDCPKEQKNL